MEKGKANNFIEEEFDPGIKNALFSNFTRATDAIKEITDNSVSGRRPGRKLIVEIDLIRKKKLRIKDSEGSGMTTDDLRYFFKWGAPKERSFQDIGAYGQGGKAAMGYLGSSMVITTSPVGEKKAYRIEDWNLHDTTKLKKYPIMEIPNSREEGYTLIEIEGLRSHIKEKEVKDELLNTYRPLIEKGEVAILFNSETLRVSPFPLDKDFEIQKFSFRISENKPATGWIGRLAPRSGIRGGLRCYHKGRLMCAEEFFGHPDPHYKGTLNFLFGEVYLDYVPVVTNKTDFRRYSEKWIETQKKMFQLLGPHIDELLGREITEPSEEEIKRVSETREIFNEVLKILKREEEGALGQGQKLPKAKGEHLPLGSNKGKRGKYEPATPPPRNAIGRRKRLGEFPEWKIRAMDELTRSVIEGKEKEKTLIINNIFPGYIANKGSQLYLLETASLQIAKPLEESLKPNDYLKAFDELFAQICNRLDEVKQILKKKKK